MDNFFKKFFKVDKPVPSKLILEGFNSSFPNAINVEWNVLKKEWEALFYDQDMECIVRFSKTGQMLEVRKNYPLDMLVNGVRQELVGRGELMNAIEINKIGVGVSYECILRDKNLNRFVVLVDENGVIKDRVNL